MKEQIREIITAYGADLCGFASIERFEDTPSGFKPTDIFADCKSVISFAVALPRGLAKVSPRLIYGYYNSIACPEVDMISFHSAKKIEQRFRCTAVPLPCDSPYEYWDDETMEGRGLISMKHAAIKAGLGSLGKSTLFLSNGYGNMVTLGAILTDLEILPDVLSENICIASCNKCIASCPVGAIENGRVNQRQCRNNTYGKTKRGFDTVDCNICRTICPLNYANSKTSSSSGKNQA